MDDSGSAIPAEETQPAALFAGPPEPAASTEPAGAPGIPTVGECRHQRSPHREREEAWPDMEATEHFREGRKYRERDLWVLHLLRRMVLESGLIERGARSFELTAPGRRLLDAGNRGALQALLFRVFFWRMDLSLFVGWHARRAPGRWPQSDIGMALWALTDVADEWQSADTLAVSCTDP